MFPEDVGEIEHALCVRAKRALPARQPIEYENDADEGETSCDRNQNGINV